MKRIYLSKLIIPILILSGLNPGVFAQTSTFNYTGAVQMYSIPAGVTMIGIDAKGGCGGGGYVSSGSPGPVVLGGRVQCTMNVTPGTSLYIYVGQAGQTDGSGAYTPYGGWNGGMPGQAFSAGGGGATDIRLTNSAVGTYTTTNRVVVAGGGGGGGDWGATGGKGGGLTGANGVIYSVYLATGGTQTSGGTQSYSSAYNATIGSGGPSGGSGGGGSGGYYGGAGGYNGGGAGGGSSYTDPVAVTSVVHTQGYSGANGNGQVIITVLCNSPGTISGSVPVCLGGSFTLTETSPGGTWSSSDSTIATVGSSSGIVTSVAPGTATITYTLPNPCGALATTTVTVNPLPSPLPATVTMCQNLTSTLTETVPGGTWSTSNATIATVGTSGVVTGVNPGTCTIAYTLPTGCAVSTTASVNPLPAPFTVTGGGAFCSGGTGVHVGLSGSTAGFDYQLISGGITVGDLTGGGSSLDYGLYTATGNYTVFATNTTSGCTNSMTGSAVITNNPLPAPITGTTSICVGANSTLSSATPGGLWTTSNPAQATVIIGTGIVTGVFAGIPTITYTLPVTGCRTTIPVTVNTNPTAITGSNNVCVGLSATLGDGVAGGTWTSSSPAVATIGSASGIVNGLTPGSSTITYTLGSGCSISMSEFSNALPSVYIVTGGGSFCAGGAGVHVGLTYSNSGVNYQLLLGGFPVSLPLPGSNSGLDFGAQTAPGTYTVVATNTGTGCSSSMTGSAIISLSLSPNVYNLAGGGNYCSGSPGPALSLDGSDIGIQYHVYNGGVATGGAHIGTGSALSLGSFTSPGTYTVLATNTLTGCTTPMSGSRLITVSPLPGPYTIGGGGNYCAGGAGVNITLAGSDAGNYYALYLAGSPTGIIDTSIGGPINFGLQTLPGVYTVVAKDATNGCTNVMSGSATIVVNPLPAAYTVIGGGGICSGGAGVHIGLNFSATGINYQLKNGLVAVGGLVPGSGSGLDFGVLNTVGIYTVSATNPSNGCTNAMLGNAIININLPPITYSVTGGGNFCVGTSGVSIGTNFSESGVNYQLYKGGTPVGVAMPGTGLGLNFGLFTSAGTYTVVATNALTGCTTNLSGSAIITLNALPIAFTVSGGGFYCAGDPGRHVFLNSSEIGVSYELFLNSITTTTVIPGTGGILDFGLQAGAGSYTVVATSGAGCTRNMTGSVTININPAPTLFNVIGGGAYCAGGTGMHVGLDGTNAGFTYQLYIGGAYGTTVGLPVSGGGSAIDFGAKTLVGTYFIVATNMLTGCRAIMNGSVAISTNPLPNDQILTGGGTRCASSPGISIDLASADSAIDYQLYRSGTPVGSFVVGVGGGGPLHFGFDSLAGVYTVIATDTVTHCSKHLPGSVVINVINPAVYTVTGGGNFCSGGTGVPVGLSGSATSETYQLYLAGVATGSAVTGTGSAISFGNQTAGGYYTVQATNIAAGCTAAMTDSAHVVVNLLPTVNTVVGGGAYCTGAPAVHVNLSGSSVAILYQLYRGSSPVGSPAAGTGSSLDFGPQSVTGYYKVKALNPATTCQSDMADSVQVTVKPLPNAYMVTIDNYGNFCAADSGLHIRLANSANGVRYQLFRSSTPVGGTVYGTGSGLDMGLQTVGGAYTVSAMDTLTTCTSNMLGSVVLNIVPLPAVYNVTGGGAFCAGGTGVHVGLDGSDAGIYYQLFDGPYSAGSLFGTGAALDFGLQIATGNYRIIANSVVTDCPNNMLGIANVKHDTLPTPQVTLRAFPGNGITVWHIDSIQALVNYGGSNPAFQWLINGNIIPGATNESFTDHQFFNNDIVTCEVTASGPCGGNTTAKSLTIVLYNVGVATVASNMVAIRLIPNPNKGVFTVKGDLGLPIAIGNEEVTMEVTNMLGQVLYSNKTVVENGKIDRQIELGNNLANGMYILNIRSGSQNSVFHFAVEK